MLSAPSVNPGARIVRSCIYPSSARIIACLTYAPRRLPSRWILIALTLAWLAWLLALPPRPSAWIVTCTGIALVALASWVAHRGHDARWGAFARRTLDWHALVVVLLIAFGMQFEDAHGVTTDGVIYFSQIRSVLFDHDLNVAAEFQFLGQPPRPYHVVPIGPTLVWLPLYLGVAGVDAAGRALGMWNAPGDAAGIGLTLPYVRAALVSSFVIGAAGVWVVHGLLRREFDKGVAFAATLLVFAATPLVWYMVYEPSMTHAASFGFVALFVAAAIQWTSTTIAVRQSITLGALLGMAFATRPQEALFALFPGFLLLTANEPFAVRGRAAVRLAAWAFVGAAPFLVLQAIHSSILFSRENFALVGAQGYLDLFHSRWADTLWSSWHGFLSWTPVAYIAVVGTAVYATRQWRWAVASLLILFLMAWINGSTADWNAGWSFGGRRFTSCLVLLAPGLAFVIHGLTRRPMTAMGLLALGAIAWNQVLMSQYSDRMLPTGEVVSFDRIVRQQAEVVTRPPFFYPFAFPANAWFAWRTGLPIDRYDLVGPETVRSTFTLTLDASAGKFLFDGWGAPGLDEWGELRWIEGARAEMVVPLDVTDEGARTLQITARSRLLDPPRRAGLAVTINGHRVGTFAPDATSPSIATFTIDRTSGALQQGFNRVVFEKAADDVPVAIYRVAVK